MGLFIVIQLVEVGLKNERRKSPRVILFKIDYTAGLISAWYASSIDFKSQRSDVEELVNDVENVYFSYEV